MNVQNTIINSKVNVLHKNIFTTLHNFFLMRILISAGNAMRKWLEKCFFIIKKDLMKFVVRVAVCILEKNLKIKS